MGWSTHHQVGLVYYAPQHCYRGYTLFATNRGGFHANLIDMQGRVCHRWYSDEGITYPYLLPNGNLLLRTPAPRDTGGPETIGGASGTILELDWDSNVVWEFRHPTLHHDFERLANGNTLVLLWEPLPEELAARVQGGYRADGEQPTMYGDLVQEVTPTGEVVYEWKSWEHLNVDEDIICPLEARREWTHGNALNVTPEGDLLVSYRLTSTVGIVDKASGEFRWKWGPGEVYHQHHPTFLDNGHVLIFDNGGHRRGPSHSRIVEVDPATNEIAWQYVGSPIISFYSYNISSAQRLPNGNTFICEGAPGRMFEVTPAKEIVWEYINPFFGQVIPGGSPESVNAVFRAHRYGEDHSGLQGKDLDPARYANLNRTYGAS